MARFTAFQKKKPGQLRADRAAHIVPMGTFALDAPCWKSALRAAFGHVLLLLLARGVIETLRDPRIVKAEIASQGRRRAAQIVRRERLQAGQRADAGRFHLALDLRAAQRGCHDLAVHRLIAERAGKDVLLLVAGQGFPVEK